MSGLSKSPKSNNKPSDSEFIQDVENLTERSDSLLDDIDNMLGYNRDGIYDAEGNFIPSDELYVSNDPIDDFMKYGTEGKEAYEARKLAEANEKEVFGMLFIIMIGQRQLRLSLDFHCGVNYHTLENSISALQHHSHLTIKAT
nr:hypothetical protein [Ningiella sp. W23]